MSITTTESKITANYLRNKTKDQLIDLCLMLSESLDREQSYGCTMLWKEALRIAPHNRPGRAGEFVYPTALGGILVDSDAVCAIIKWRFNPEMENETEWLRAVHPVTPLPITRKQ